MKARYVTDSEEREAELPRHTFSAYFTIDVEKLIELTRGQKVRLVPIGDVKCLLKMPRSLASGFSRLRLAEADISYPLIVSKRMELLDGRHRLLLLRRNRAKWASVVVASGAQIGRCIVRLW